MDWYCSCGAEVHTVDPPDDQVNRLTAIDGDLWWQLRNRHAEMGHDIEHQPAPAAKRPEPMRAARA